MAAMRSDSLCRSSPASRISVRPSACVAATARIGISSMIDAIVGRVVDHDTVQSASVAVEVARGLVGAGRARVDRERGAHALEHVQQADAPRVDAGEGKVHARAGNEERRHDEKRRGGEIAGHRDVNAFQRGAAAHADGVAVARHVGAHRGQHDLGVVARRHAVRPRWSRPPRTAPRSGRADFTCALGTGIS